MNNCELYSKKSNYKLRILWCFIKPLMYLEMSLDLTLVLVLDLDLDQAIQSMWRPPYKAIKCWSADEEILSKCLECRQGCKKKPRQPPDARVLWFCTENQS